MPSAVLTPIAQSRKGATCDKIWKDSSTKLVSSEPPDLYTRLINEARFIAGDDQEFVPIKELSWIDKTLVNESIDFHRRFFGQVLFANMAALMFGFSVKPNSAVLLRTGRLNDPDQSYQRFLSTIHRVGEFFTLPFDPVESYKALSVVRRMHVLASKKPISSSPSGNYEPWKTELVLAIRKDLAHIDTSFSPNHALTWKPPVPVSQFDMATTQFGFWGAFWCFPEVFGISDRDKDMRGVIHVWAIFGRLLGIRDEFNICLKPDPDFYEKLYRTVIVHSLKTVDETVITLQDSFMSGVSKRLPFITHKSLLFLGFSNWTEYNFQGNNLWKLMSSRDKICFKFMEIMLWALRNVSGFRLLFNIIAMIWLQIQFWIHLPNAPLWPVSKQMYSKMK